jgi:Neurotransmitter-gated ion-channel ligand binding domain
LTSFSEVVVNFIPYIILAADGMTKVERPLTKLDQLIKVIFNDYDPYKIPENLEEVKITSMVVKKVSYNIRKSIMETLVVLDLSWKDEKLSWDPNEYLGIEEINSRLIKTTYVWRPTLRLMK